MRILIVDRDLLYANTIAGMFEVFSSEVRVATSLDDAFDMMWREAVPALVVGEAFLHGYGMGLRPRLNLLDATPCLAVISSRHVPESERSPLADIYLRPSCFFSDLRGYLLTRAS